MVSLRRIWVVAFAAIAVAIAPGPAFAEEAKTQAEALFREGREALSRGDTVSACDKLGQSNRLDPAPGTQLNLGECEAQRGHIATAYFLFLAVERQLSDSDLRAPVARSKRQAAESRLPSLKVQLPHGAPSETRVIIAGRSFAPPELLEPVNLDPGTVEVTITAPGYESRAARVILEEAKLTSLVVLPLELQRVEQISKPVTVPYASEPIVRVPRSPVFAEQATRGKSTGGVILGVGIGSTVLGGLAGILTLDARRTNKEHCNATTQTCDATGRDAASRGQLLGGLTTAGFVIGAVGISVGTVLLVRKPASKPAATLGLQMTGSGAALSLHQSF